MFLPHHAHILGFFNLMIDDVWWHSLPRSPHNLDDLYFFALEYCDWETQSSSPLLCVDLLALSALGVLVTALIYSSPG